MTRAKTVFPELAQMLKRALGDLVDPSAEDFLDLMAEDATMEFPYAPPGAPKKVTGHAALAAYLAPLTHVLTVESVNGLTVHRTQDPRVVILEFSIKGRITKTGEPYDQSYVEVITIEGGRITSYRDYWNPLLIPSLGT